MEVHASIVARATDRDFASGLSKNTNVGTQNIMYIMLELAMSGAILVATRGGVEVQIAHCT